MPANYLFTEANDWLYNVTDPLFEEIKNQSLPETISFCTMF